MTSWRIGIGSVTWGNEPAYYWITPPTIDEMLGGIVSAGYSAIEWALKPTDDPAIVQRHLIERRVSLVGSFSFADLIDRAQPRDRNSRAWWKWAGKSKDWVAIRSFCVIRSGRTGSEIAGRVTPADAMSESEHQAMVLGLNHAAEKLAEVGVHSTFHPHAGTLIETRSEFERLLSAVDPSLIGFCPGHWTHRLCRRRSGRGIRRLCRPDIPCTHQRCRWPTSGAVQSRGTRLYGDDEARRLRCAGEGYRPTSHE